jgi:hypothetical protein
LTARAEGALRHFFQHIVAADGFDDFFLGLVAVVFIVAVIVAVRSGMFGVFRRGGLAVLVLGLLVVVGIVGMRRVLERVRLMFVMPVLFFLVFAGFCRERLDGCRIGQGHRRQRLARVRLGAFFIGVVVLVVGMLMMVVVMMPGIVVMLRAGMVRFGVVDVAGFGVHAFGVRALVVVALFVTVFLAFI